MQGHRQDAWTKDEDVILAETVLHYIREGKTQLEAFKEAGNKLSRTSAACGFRWNATLRKHYEQAIQSAKNNRKKVNPYTDAEAVQEMDQPNFTQVIQSLEKISQYYQTIDQAKKCKELEEENRQLIDKLQLSNHLLEEIKKVLDKWDKSHN
ncbi:transcription factor, RsfA family [Gracilibacillus ureilyticus]|uniref:Transcription factor, RsfA family n=1 Tax=Gracilibacillus ureilyticus TaxID=531814 RepID=A0A1H9TIN8_9BACI|nr:RsfA family transcriptional regulator [Gracilibacillus ureilyticus]SER96709.1 transcription factor, RsfA family [Gracilibacillus ureilyticus]